MGVSEAPNDPIERASQDEIVAGVIGLAPGLWLATWLFQVIPVFFFVGGYANLIAFDSARRRGESVVTFVRQRVRRLLVPSLVFVALWLPSRSSFTFQA